MADSDKLVLEGDLELWEVEGGLEPVGAFVGERAVGDELARFFGVLKKHTEHQLTGRGDRPLARVRLTVEVLAHYET